MLLLTSESGTSTSSKSFDGDLLNLLSSRDVQRHAEAFASSPIQAVTSNEVWLCGDGCFLCLPCGLQMKYRLHNGSRIIIQYTEVMLHTTRIFSLQQFTFREAATNHQPPLPHCVGIS